MVRSSKPKSPLKSAVFVKQKFILSQPDSDHKTTPLLDLMGNLRNSGVLTTANQALNVESSWATLIPEYIAYAHRTGHFAKLVKFNYTTFWEPTADETSKNVAINLNILWGAFQNFVKEASETRGPLVIGATNLKLTEVLSTCNPVKSNKLKSWQNPLGKGRDGKPPKNAPRNLITFASVLRYVCDDIPLIMNIRDLLASPPTTYPQNKVPVKDQDQETIEFFRDINFIRIYVLGTSTAAADHLIERVLVERAMLHALRTKLDGEKGEAVKEDLEKHWPSMPCANIKDVFHEVNEVLKNKVEEEKKPKKPKNSKQSKGKTTKKREFKGRRPLNDVDVQYIGNGTKLTGKLNFAIQSTLFRDIVKTMLKYGMNPKVTFVGENNHKLHLLVK